MYVPVNNCKSPYGCWEPNLGHVQEQQVILTMGTSLQPPMLDILTE